MKTSIGLTKRQKAIMPLLEQGLSNPEIAKHLGLTEHTIKVHLWRMYRKLGVRNRTEAVRWFREHMPGETIHALNAAFNVAAELAKLLDPTKLTAEQHARLGDFNFHARQVLALKGQASSNVITEEAPS